MFALKERLVCFHLNFYEFVFFNDLGVLFYKDIFHNENLSSSWMYCAGFRASLIQADDVGGFIEAPYTNQLLLSQKANVGNAMNSSGYKERFTSGIKEHSDAV